MASVTAYPSIYTPQADGGGDWYNTSRLNEADLSFAHCDMAFDSSKSLDATGYDFSAVPEGATIDGVILETTVKNTWGTTGRDETIQLIVGGTPAGDNKASATLYPGTSEERSYGGASDTWSAAPTAADVRSSDFGIRVKCQRDIGEIDAGEFDYLRLIVHYTGGGDPPPEAPTGLSATDGDHPDKVVVSWTTPGDSTGVFLYRSETNDPDTAEYLFDTNLNSYEDTSAVPGATYYYWAKNQWGGEYSAFSTGDSGYAAAGGSVPDVPGNVAATDDLTDKVTVSWDAAAGADTYTVARNTSNSTSGATELAAELTGTSYDDTTAVAGTPYYYFVKATNTTGDSAYSTGAAGLRAEPAPVALQTVTLRLGRSLLRFATPAKLRLVNNTEAEIAVTVTIAQLRVYTVAVDAEGNPFPSAVLGRDHKFSRLVTGVENETLQPLDSVTTPNAISRVNAALPDRTGASDVITETTVQMVVPETVAGTVGLYVLPETAPGVFGDPEFVCNLLPDAY